MGSGPPKARLLGMKVGPGAGAGANLGSQLRPVRIAPAPACLARTRRERPKPLAGDTEPVGLHYPGWVLWIFRIRVVIQSREGTDRVGVGHVLGRTATRRASYLTSESGTCTCTRKGGRTGRNREQ